LLAHPGAPYTIYRELPTRLDSLMSGGALALIVRTERGARWVASRKMALHGLALAGVAVFCLCVVKAHSSFYSRDAMQRFGYAAESVLFAATIALALQPGTWAARLGEVRWLRVVGKYSYGIYIFHQIPMKYDQEFLQWMDGLTPFPMVASVVGTAMVFALTMGVAALSYHTVEMYFLRMKRWFAYDDERKAHRVTAEQDTTVAVS